MKLSAGLDTGRVLRVKTLGPTDSPPGHFAAAGIPHRRNSRNVSRPRVSTAIPCPEHCIGSVRFWIQPTDLDVARVSPRQANNPSLVRGLDDRGVGRGWERPLPSSPGSCALRLGRALRWVCPPSLVSPARPLHYGSIQGTVAVPRHGRCFGARVPYAQTGGRYYIPRHTTTGKADARLCNWGGGDAPESHVAGFTVFQFWPFQEGRAAREGRALRGSYTSPLEGAGAWSCGGCPKRGNLEFGPVRRMQNCLRRGRYGLFKIWCSSRRFLVGVQVRCACFRTAAARREVASTADE